MKVKTPLKWHGGKSYLAKRILELAPPRAGLTGYINYVEPFCGGSSVLLAHNPIGVSEIVNDTSWQLTNFWQVLKNEALFKKFQRRIESTPFSETEWKIAAKVGPDEILNNPVLQAVVFFVKCRQSLAGRGKSFTGITKTRTRRGMNNEVSGWLSAVEGLSAVHARLKRVLILNRDALDVIEEFDKPRTWIYTDPPYMLETRTAKQVYDHEMSYEDHLELLNTLEELEHAKFTLSGYPSDLYKKYAKRNNWNVEEIKIRNHASGSKEKREMTELLIMNF